MSNINDGGPAFPVLDTSQNLATGETTVHQACYSGMTLRDYFAAKAMPWVASDVPAGSSFQDKVAVLSYAMADAMLEARKEQK
jgi:hypothetical protein